MRKFVFNIEKYGFPLLMDLHGFEDNPNVHFDSKPHITDFFEIVIFEKANGIIELNGHVLEVKDNSFSFVVPFKKKEESVPRLIVTNTKLIGNNNELIGELQCSQQIFAAKKHETTCLPNHRSM